MWLTGPAAPRHVGSSQTRARTRVPCISRQILNHCATREAPWIIFTIITLNSFSGRLPISSSFVWSREFLPCSFICCLFLCVLILLNLLCLGPPFLRLQICSSHCFWCRPPVGKFGSVGCVGFLVEMTGACVLVDAATSCVSGGQDHVRWCVLGCL